MLIFLSVLGVIVLAGILFLSLSPQFGGKADGKRVEALKASPNFDGSHFQNLVETEMGIEPKDLPKLISRIFFGTKQNEPGNPIPTAFDHGPLSQIDTAIYVTWYGHSAILLELEGKKILIDPMLGPASSPLPFMTKRYEYQQPLNLDDIPTVDAVLISHDHYDHLDYSTIKTISDRVDHFYTPLVVGEHLKSWGVDSDRITELDWWQSAKLGTIELVAAPARHFSGRGLSDRNKSQWASWVILGEKSRVYFSGDGGYEKHFSEIGEKYGPFDFSMIECGQYNELWAAIHMMPEQSVQASIDLNSALMMPIHWGAFNLALHHWTDPIVRASKEADRLGVDLIHPVIGERIMIGQEYSNRDWWNLPQQ